MGAEGNEKCLHPAGCRLILFMICKRKIVNNMTGLHNLTVDGDHHSVRTVGAEEGIDHAADHHQLSGRAVSDQLIRKSCVKIQKQLRAFHPFGIDPDVFVQDVFLNQFSDHILSDQLRNDYGFFAKAIRMIIGGIKVELHDGSHRRFRCGRFGGDRLL